MRLPLAITSIFVAISLLAGPVSAAPLGAALSKTIAAQPLIADDAQIIRIQHRSRGGGGGHGGGGHDDGGAIAAGVVGGLLLGAIIANEAQRNRGSDYCARRFRSYDPGSGTYLGNDGYRHRCP